MIDIKHKKIRWLPYVIFIILTLGATMATYYNAHLYSRPIGKIISEESTFQKEVNGFDGKKIHPEKYYNQTLNVIILNGKLKGETVTIFNSYTKSQVYDQKYVRGQIVFVDNISHKTDDPNNSQKQLVGQVGGIKRDYIIVLAIFLVSGVFLIVGGREGVFVLISLFGNLILFYAMVKLYLNGINMLIMAIPLSIIFSFLLVVFMYGLKADTWISMVASSITLLGTLAIAYILMRLSPNIDYDFMDYLQQPYDQTVANNLFLSQIAIASIGAIMDMVITLVITANQIFKNATAVSISKLLASLRTVGDQIVGTMIAIMFFTNIASTLPFALLSLRNGIGIATVLRYHSFFYIARFLTGSIAVVGAIPVTTAVLYLYYKRKEAKNVIRP